MNWFGKILDLPKEFLNESEGLGGGVLQVLFCNNLYKSMFNILNTSDCFIQYVTVTHF